jgi:hypothetical protein
MEKTGEPLCVQMRPIAQASKGIHTSALGYLRLPH